MKKHLILAIIGMITSTMMISCDNSDDVNINSYIANSVVTIKPLNNGAGFNIWVSDDLMGQASNITKSPYGNKEVRALANIRKEGKDANGVQKFYVNWLDSIRTKPTVFSINEKEDAKKYGDDPLEIVKDFVTVAEDGYLTLRFRTLWGVPNLKHEVNLVTGINKDDPYKLLLRHNAKGDLRGRVVDGLVAFRLSEIDKIAMANGKKDVTLELHWKSYSGMKHTTFKYHVRNDKK